MGLSIMGNEKFDFNADCNYSLPDDLKTIVSKYATVSSITPNDVQLSFTFDINKWTEYLEKYFPRTYVESLFAFVPLFTESNINEHILKKIKNGEIIKCLFLGCGTGGEVFGFIYSLMYKFPKEELENSTIELTLVDCNNDALELLKKILNEYVISKIKFDFVVEDIFNNQNYLSDNNNRYDFVSSFKMINEMISYYQVEPRNASIYYRDFISKCCNLLTEKGIFILLELTDKRPNEETGKYLSMIVTKGVGDFLSKSNEFNAIIPMCTAIFQGRCSECFIKNKLIVNNKVANSVFFAFTRRGFAEKINKWTTREDIKRLSDEHPDICPKGWEYNNFHIAYNFYDFMLKGGN